MNSRLIRALLAGGLMTGQAALAETKTFTGETGYRWAQGGSWDPPNAPLSSDDVIIPSGLEQACVIDVTDAVARTITIATNEELQIKEGGTLTLHGDGVTSYINGQLKFVDGSSGDAVLWFKNDHTLNTSEDGSGSERVVRGEVLGIIKGDSGAVLTVNRDVSPLSLKGNLRVEIELVNNANVEAHLGDLTLAENPQARRGLLEGHRGYLDGERGGHGMRALGGRAGRNHRGQRAADRDYRAGQDRARRAAPAERVLVHAREAGVVFRRH